MASCCVIVLAPCRTPPAAVLVHIARAIPRGSMPQWVRKRRSSIAMKASVTWAGSSVASTGLPILAPRSAIGVPSADSRVIDGGAGGSSDLESGAVNASQPIARIRRMRNTPEPRMIQRSHQRKGRFLPGETGAAGGGGGSPASGKLRS